MRSDWVRIIKINGGHAYWRRLTDGAIGIADGSGTYSEDCEPADKPPLLLDQKRPVAMDGGFCMVPVKHDDGHESWTPASGYEALWVVTTFEMTLAARQPRSDIELRVFVARIHRDIDEEDDLALPTTKA